MAKTLNQVKSSQVTNQQLCASKSWFSKHPFDASDALHQPLFLNFLILVFTGNFKQSIQPAESTLRFADFFSAPL
jgi:hypothetical protein